MDEEQAVRFEQREAEVESFDWIGQVFEDVEQDDDVEAARIEGLVGKTAGQGRDVEDGMGKLADPGMGFETGGLEPGPLEQCGEAAVPAAQFKGFAGRPSIFEEGLEPVNGPFAQVLPGAVVDVGVAEGIGLAGGPVVTAVESGRGFGLAEADKGLAGLTAKVIGVERDQVWGGAPAGWGGHG